MSEGGIPLEQANTTKTIQEKNKDSLPKAFVGSELVRLIEAQRRENGFSGVLFTDIDNTFYRKDKASASAELIRIAKENKFPIVAVTGNSFSLDGVTPGVMKRIQSGELPYFEAIAGAVGTEVWVLHVDENGVRRYEKDEDFERKMVSKDFNRKELAKKSDEMVKEFRTSRQEWSLDFQNPALEKDYLEGRTTEIQPFKISFYAFASSQEEIGNINREVGSHFPNQKVIICEEVNYNDKMSAGDTRKKYCIDILPVTKADVVDYIGSAIKTDVKIVAGDSGNDKVMLTGTGDFSISVGGSKPELKQAIESATQEGSGRGSFRKVKTQDGKLKYYYSEKGSGLGPESILRAAEILKRAQRRFKPQLSKVSS